MNSTNNQEKNVILIGTLHSGWTPRDELIETIKEMNPDKLFVELSPEELSEERRNTSIRDEMFAAYDWANQHNIPVAIFDEENDVLKEGVTGSEPIFAELEQESKKILKDYSWKELNHPEPWQHQKIKNLQTKLYTDYVDAEKSNERERTLARNIAQNLIAGTNVILTGTAHLDYFSEQFPQAKIPLRGEV